MKYNFDQETNRLNTGSYKWDVAENELPMWVADMDFEAAPEIIEALQERLDHKIFGYNIVPDEYYESIQGWWKRRHHFEIEKDWIIFSTGVVPSISSVVRRLTLPGENVLIQSPVYNIFYNSILNNGRNVLSSDLVYDGYEYHIDWEDLESKLANPQTSLMILCNPHNPVGKIWDRDTLARIGSLCAKYHVVVISDEIHCDITAPGKEYIPFASVNEVNKNISVTCIAPTKAFNLAGMQSSCMVIAEPFLRHKVNRGLNNEECAEPNSFAVTITIAAFNKGEEWINELREYVEINKKEVVQFIEKELPQLHVCPSEATYLLWIDCSNVCDNSIDLVEHIRKETGLYLSEGYEYGENGKKFIRMNVATTHARVLDGLNRFKKGIISYQK